METKRKTVKQYWRGVSKRNERMKKAKAIEKRMGAIIEEIRCTEQKIQLKVKSEKNGRLHKEALDGEWEV